jgi:hypothetical protein
MTIIDSLDLAVDRGFITRAVAEAVREASEQLAVDDDYDKYADKLIDLGVATGDFDAEDEAL